MSLRRYAFAAAAALAVLVVLAAPAHAQSSAVAERVKKLTEDLEHPLKHKRLEAIDRLGRMGKDAARSLPRLLIILKRESDVSTKVHAARAAARIEPDNSEVYARLQSFLEDRSNHYKLREVSAIALGEMAAKTPTLAPRIVPVLAHELASGQHGNLVDVALAESLAALKEEAAGAAEDIEAALERSPFGDVQISTFIALARVSKAQPGLRAEDLAAQLDDPKLAVRARAFGQLRGMGPRAKSALEALLKKTAPANKIFERVAALDCLGAVEPQNQKSIAAFVAAIGDESRYLQGAGGKGLARLLPAHAGEAVEPLLTHIAASKDAVKRTLIETIHRIAPRDPKVVAQMVSLLASANKSSDILYIYEILEALRGAGPAGKGAQGRLVEILDRSNALYEGRHPVEAEEIIGHSLVVLAEVGIPANARQKVFDEVARKEKFTLTPAIRAVGSMGGDGAGAVKALIAVIEGERITQPTLPFLHDAYPDLEAIRALGRIGPPAKDAIPALNKVAARDQKGLSQIEVLEVQAARRALQEIQG